MIDASDIPSVSDDELLARYVVQKSQFRSGDGTIKPDVFIPHPHGELSVTRHRDATEEEIWQVGRDVAEARKRTLYGRADLPTSTCRSQSLDVEASPLPENPNHANVVGWPAEKQDQKAIAIRLATAAGALIPVPPSG